MRAAFLGPEGTYSHAAVRGDARAAGWEPVPVPTVHDAVLAVERGEAERALIPVENSLEGAVGPALDALAVHTQEVRIVGEVLLPISHSLVARGPAELSDVRVVLSHPQANAQCARFLREQLPGATVLDVSSTAEAVRLVATGQTQVTPAAALGTPLAARLHGATVLREAVEDDRGNVTRFVWVAREGTPPMGAPTKTSVVWWGAGDESAGWLVRCLSEFAFRGINLTKIESRPQRLGLGHYMFFADLDGAGTDGSPVAASIAALRAQATDVRVLGTYPAAGA